MSYTPINWQTGDVITAEKLNKMDNGWGVGSTQLFSETVTTVAGDNIAQGAFSYNENISADTIVVTFDGTDYSCARIDGVGGTYFYGGFTGTAPDFSEYPFFIRSTVMGNEIYTQNAGTYTVAVSVQDITVSNDFEQAASIAVANTLPLLCEDGKTLRSEVKDAWDNQRICYCQFAGTMYYITSYSSSSLTFIPESTSVTFSFQNGVFTVTES